MKKISLILFGGIVALFIYALLATPVEQSVPRPAPPPQTATAQSIPLDALNQVIESDSQRALAPEQKDQMMVAAKQHNARIAAERRIAEERVLEERMTREDVEPPHYMPLVKLIIKFVFSMMFGGAALYVVLSRKYDGDTQKWAFSVLSLISGVWIGTVT